MNKIPIWKKLCDLLSSAGVDVGTDLNFHKLFTAAANLNSVQMFALKQILDPFTIRWVSGLARLAPTTCGNDIFTEASLSEEALLSIQKPILALYDEHTAFQATKDFLKERHPNCSVEDVPFANHLAPMDNPDAFLKILKRYLSSVTQVV